MPPRPPLLPGPRMVRISSMSNANRRSFEASLSKTSPLKRQLSLAFPGQLPDLAGQPIKSCSANTLPLPELDFQVDIEILSNYGSESAISCSEIDLLGPDKVPLPIVSITSSDPAENIQTLFKLSDGQIVKTAADQCWSHKWPQPSYVLTFYVSSAEPPAFLRIWNFDSDASVKTVKIVNTNDQIFEVPKDFCGIFPLTHHVEKVKPKKPAMVGPMLTDNAGILPLPFISSLKLILLQTFIPSSTHVGLNSIEFFGGDGARIPGVEVGGIDVENGTCITSSFKLLKEKMRTTQLEDMWVAQKEKPELPTALEFKFKDKIQVSMIRIWNYNAGAFSDEYGASKGKILIDGHQTWIGKLKKAKGMTTKMEEGVTDIWFTDGQELRKQNPDYQLITSRDENGS